MSVRVLHVTFFADRQGRRPKELLKVWPTLTNVAEAVQAEGYDVTVLQAACEDALIERKNVRYHFIAERPGTRRTALRPTKLISRARDLAPDLLHVHSFLFPLQTRQLRRALPNVPMIVQDHADKVPPGWRRPIDRRMFADIAAAAFTAKELAQPFFEANIIRSDLPIHEVLEGSTTMTAGSQSAARARTGMTGDPCVLWVGRLIRRKHPLTILEAFARFVTEFPDARLYMCYSNETLLPEVQNALAENAALAERVHLLGLVPHTEISHLYASADVFVLGSDFEGSGFALVEALACGVTPVVTDISPFRAITGGVTGEHFPVGDVAACTRALSIVAKQDRTTLRAKAIEHFRNALSYEVIGKQLREAYQAVLV